MRAYRATIHESITGCFVDRCTCIRSARAAAAGGGQRAVGGGPSAAGRGPEQGTAAQAGSRIVVSTSTTCGTRGIDAKPNATGGSSGAREPRGSPAQVPRTPVTSCAPVTP